MKLAKTILLAATTASTVLAAPAVVTVTQHVHQEATVTVQGYVYVSNGQTYTTIPTASLLQETDDGLIPTSSSVVPQTGSTDSTTTLTSTITSTRVTSSSTYTAVTSTISTTPAATSTSSDFATAMLNEHNAKRELHTNTPDLTWSDTLATYAQNYADEYDCSGALTHSGGSYGENLALGYGTTGAVDAWYNEISSYDFSNPGFSSSTGHFTQVVWKSTSQVGCGIKTCGNEWGDYIVCSYESAGNVIGYFAENVLALA